MTKKNNLIIEEAEEELNEEEFRSTRGKKNTGGDNKVLITREGLKKLQEELEHLTNVSRKEVAARLKEAISYGDLSENSEYEEAKNEQAFIEARILELEYKIKNAKIIKGHDTQRVQIGTIVTLKKVGSTKEDSYTIVGTTEADPFGGKISNESPIGNAIMDHQKGDRVNVETPGGTVRYEIMKLK